MAMLPKLEIEQVVIAGQKANMVLTVTNTGADAVVITGFVFSCLPVSTSVVFGSVNMGPGVSLSVPGDNGTLKFGVPVIFHAPQRDMSAAWPSRPAANTHQIFATVMSAAAADTSPRLSVSVNLPTNTPVGGEAVSTFQQFRFDNGRNSGYVDFLFV